MATATDIGTMIVRTPGIHSGRPRIAGTGVTVGTIAGLYRSGLSPEQIAHEIEHLSLAQIYTGLAYYHANREELDAEFEREEREGLRIEELEKKEKKKKHQA
jgi:uncharacterized protein (DUF433 family)